MTKPINDLTASYVRNMLSYDPETGTFAWLSCANSRPRKGDRAGYVRRDGYRAISIHGRKYPEHRLAYLWMTGTWPPADMDHVDGNRANNAWGNLRACTCAENAQNVARPRTNSSGAIGVTWNKSCKKWQSSIKNLGKSHYLGLFDTVTEASAAYLAAKNKLHTFQPIPRALASKNYHNEERDERQLLRLTNDDVMRIFRATGRQVDIAARFGTTQSQVSRIKLRKARVDVTQGLIA